MDYFSVSDRNVLKVPEKVPVVKKIPERERESRACGKGCRDVEHARE